MRKRGRHTTYTHTHTHTTTVRNRSVPLKQYFFNSDTLPICRGREQNRRDWRSNSSRLGRDFCRSAYCCRYCRCFVDGCADSGHFCALFPHSSCISSSTRPRAFNYFHNVYNTPAYLSFSFVLTAIRTCRSRMAEHQSSPWMQRVSRRGWPQPKPPPWVNMQPVPCPALMPPPPCSSRRLLESES